MHLDLYPYWIHNDKRFQTVKNQILKQALVGSMMVQSLHSSATRLPAIRLDNRTLNCSVSPAHPFALHLLCRELESHTKRPEAIKQARVLDLKQGKRMVRYITYDPKPQLLYPDGTWVVTQKVSLDLETPATDSSCELGNPRMNFGGPLNRGLQIHMEACHHVTSTDGLGEPVSHPHKLAKI